MPPRDSAHGHTPLPTADVFRHARSFCGSCRHQAGKSLHHASVLTLVIELLTKSPVHMSSPRLVSPQSVCESDPHQLSLLQGEAETDGFVPLYQVPADLCLTVSGLSQCETSGKHRGNSPSQTKIQRHEFDRVVVHGTNWVRSNDCQRRATSEKSVCRKTRSVF